MVFFASFILMLNMVYRTASVPAGASDFFTPEEKAKIEKTDSAESRIKIYRNASERIQKSLHKSVDKEEFDSVPDTLKRWTSLLEKSFDDIQANLKAKKKPGSLIDYEIQVRKAIVAMKEHKIKVPVEQQDAFDACLAQAESIRRKMMEILFKL
jgi:hypothetical protein